MAEGSAEITIDRAGVADFARFVKQGDVGRPQLDLRHGKLL
jgi:hypothetical protein